MPLKGEMSGRGSLLRWQPAMGPVPPTILWSLRQRSVTEAASPGTELGDRVTPALRSVAHWRQDENRTPERDLGFFLFLLSWMFCILQVKQ